MIDLEKIYKSGQTFLWDEVVDKRGNVCYLVRNAGNWALVQQNGENYSIRMGGFCEGSWQEYFDDYTDYETIVGAFRQKGIVDDAVKAGAGLRILRQTPWEAAVQFVISQNNNIPRIKKCVDALARRFNGEIEVFGERYAACLPKPRQIVEAGPGALEGLGLGYRAKYLFNLAVNWEKIIAQIWADDSYENHFKTLCGVYGIGAKVANCVCLFGLHDVDAVPIDVWMARIIERAMGGVFPSATPGAGILQQYLFWAVKNCPEIKEKYLGSD